MYIWLPAAVDVIQVHEELVSMFLYEDPIDPPGVKSHHLLESACYRPHTAGGGIDKYQTTEHKIAALFHSLVKNHAFHNGNKRTALATMIMVLHKNKKKFKTQVPDNTLFQIVTGVASNTYPEPCLLDDEVVQSLKKFLKESTEPLQFKMSDMSSGEFLDKCHAIPGVTWRVSSQSYLIRNSNTDKSINFKMSTRKLKGNIVRRYLKVLGLLNNGNGLIPAEFQNGVNSEQEQIRRFRNVLRRLANA